MKKEQEQVASMGKTYSGIDLESIRENSVLLMVCVRDVTKRPRYFDWTEKMGLASGASKRHPDHFSCSWGPSRYWSPSMHSEFQLNRRGNHGQ